MSKITRLKKNSFSVGKTRLNIVLHVGPHKTGTTTLQEMLRMQFGCPVKGHPWCPPYLDPHGAGHAHLVRAYWPDGNGDIGDYESVYAKLYVEAAQAGVSSLILSSEFFIHAIEDGFSPLLSVLKGHDIHLVFTLTPYLRRSVSYWQEMVKWGEQRSLASCAPKIFRRMGPLEPTMVSRFINAVKPTRTSLVMVDFNARPENLVCNFWKAANLGHVPNEILEAASIKKNTSLDYVETEILRFVNEKFPDTGELRWLFLDNLFKDQIWIKAKQRNIIPIPDKIRKAAAKAAAIMIKDIEKAATMARIDIIGDLQSLSFSGYSSD